ncbi:hypothetical protein IJD34_07470 [bacterium]|nr:hypothetical protein [bacterium]
MKKKLIASFLLTTFITNTAYAEKIMFDSYGRQIKNQESTKNKVLTDTTTEKNTNQAELISQAQTTTENTMTEKQAGSQLNKYIEKNRQHLEGIVQSFDKLKINSLLASQNNGVVSSFDVEVKEIKGRVELPWYNNNYIVWNTGMGKNYFYSAEFDSERNITGFVPIINENNTYICHEFLGWDNFNVPRTTTFIYYKDSDAAFLLDSDGEIMMYKIKDDIQNLKPTKIKNPDFIKDITKIFDNPKAAVKAGVKYSVKPETVAEKKIDDSAFVNLNYKASTFNMDLSQAIKGYYGVDAENEPLIIRAYNLQRKNGVLKTKMNLKNAPKRPESYFIALEKGIIPKYFDSTYYVCDNEVMMNLLVEAYDLMLKNNFSEKDIKNFMYFIRSVYYNDTQTISFSDIESIIDDKSIPKEDKIYYIYAKMNAVHHNNSNVETDIINSLKLLKQNPKIVKKGIYPSFLNDETLVILNFDTERCCNTEEIIKKVLDMKNLSDEEKFFRILGEIKKETLKKEKENYPEILYQVAETGIMQFGFIDEEAMEYYNDEKVLQDVLSASKLLIKNKYWEWVQDENGDIFTIVPELCLTTKIVQEVLNDKKIPMKDKEEIMARRLLKEKYLAHNEKNINDLLPEDAFLLIEKGYFPKLCEERDLKSYAEEAYKFIELCKRKNFSDTHIKTLIACGACDIDIAEKINSPNEILKQHANKWFRSGSEDAIKKLYEIGLINIDNIESIEIKRWNFRKVSNEDIETLAKLKTINGFTDYEIQRYINDHVFLIPYISKALNLVLNDSSIKVEDREVFTYALVCREYEKAEYPNAPESYREAIDSGIVPYYENDDKYCKGVLEIYKYMKEDLGYTGKQIDSIIKYSSKTENPDYNVKIDKVIKVVKDEKSDFGQKNAKLSKALRQAEVNVERKDFIKELPKKILIAVTFPIWIIPALVLGLILKDYDFR